MIIAAILFNNLTIGNILLLFAGLIIACAIIYAILLACKSPPWVYTIAAVTGLVVLLIIVIDLFFGGGVADLNRSINR